MKKCLFILLMLISVNVMGQNDYFVSTREQGETIKPEISEEKQFILDNFKYINIADWKKGMRFMVVDNDTLMARFREKSLAGRYITDFYHQIITVDTVQEYNENILSKGIDTYISFNTADGDVLKFRCFGDKKHLRKNELNECIRGLVYLDEIDIAKELLVGKTFYTLTDKGYVDTPDGERVVRVLRFSPYKVIAVGVGDTYSGPLKMVCTDNDGKKVAFYVILSGTNKDYGDGIGNGYFYNAFSFSNPRNKYKNITDSDWILIRQGKVRIGMTKAVCELSWGKPQKINKTIGTYGTTEQWVYEGSYLYFKNGKLTSIQN